MYNIYFKIGFRNLLKRKGYSLINIGGLALGMAVALIIALWIWDEISFNKYADDYPYIARVNRRGKGYSSYVLPTGLGTQLKTDYGNHFKHVVMIRARLEERAIATDDKNFLQNGYFMQSDGTDMFSLNMIYGRRDGLNDLNSIFLSESLSEKLFGNVDPVNRIISMDSKWDLRVTGVYKDMPKNSELSEASYFAPLDLFLKGWSSLDIWDNYNMFIYVELNPQDDFDKVSSVIKDVIKPYENNSENEILLHPWSAWKTDYINGSEVLSTRFVRVCLFGAIGIFLLILACINFINLSTARYERRAKEVGIKKTIGSSRGQLIGQFLSESAVFVMLSFLVALFLTDMFLPVFNQIADKNLIILWDKPIFWLTSIAFMLFTVLLAGSYPAFYLSSFSPLKTIKGTLRSGSKARVSRKALVIFQFTVSISLIIASIVVYQQIQMAKNRSVGYSVDGLITLPIRSQEYYKKFDALRNELKRTGVVIDIAQSNYPITSDKGWNGGFDWLGKDPGYGVSFNTMVITPEYGQTVGLEFIDGRDFSREISSDQSGIIINESALKIMGLKNPVGQTISCPPILNNGGKRYTILGVTKEMIKGSPYEPAFPSVMFYAPNYLEQSFIRINPSVNINEALPEITKVFHSLVPSVPFDFKFVNDEFNKKFSAEENIGKLAGIFSFIAIFISCLGLFGLASFITEQRSKELGIRKVHGASVIRLWNILSTDFILLVFISGLIAIPVSYYFLNKWLQNYIYHINISWWVFIIATLGSLSIALLTVSYHTIKAALTNPVDYLRSE